MPDTHGPDRATPSTVGAQILADRTTLGWSQQQVADAAGVDVKTVGRAETGRTREPAKFGLIRDALAAGLAEQRDRVAAVLDQATMPELLGAVGRRYGRDVRSAALPAGAIPEQRDREHAVDDRAVL